MSDITTQDPIIGKLTDLQKEYAQHKERLKARAKVVQGLELPVELKELFLELTDTVFSLQSDLLDGVVDALQAETEIDPEGGSMLLAEDSDIIGAALDSYSKMLTELIKNNESDATVKAQLGIHLAQCQEALTLVDQITIDDDAETGEEPDGEDGGDEDET